jgi:hypothetical protein
MPINSNTFAACAPNLTTNIRSCGTVTLCSAKPVTADELNPIYMRGNDYRVMEALFHHEMELRQCEVVQNGLYDFFMANKVPVNKNLQTRRVNSGLIEIAPFVMARQYSPINNKYWQVSGGTASGGNWSVVATSATNIPADVNYFPVGLRVLIHGKNAAGGAHTVTQWLVVSATLAGNTVVLVLSPQNSGTKLDAAKIANPVTGLLLRGTPNVHNKEKFCAEMPTLLNWKNVPFWVETTRTSMCWSTLYGQWRDLMLQENALYKEFGDLDDIQKNKQLGLDWQERLVNMMFWGKPISQFQTADAYDLLDDISAYAGILDTNGNQILGAEGGKCAGKRANAIGIYEQLGACGRIYDALGAQLSIPSLAKELYNMRRIRQGNGHPNPNSFDIFTDSITADKFNTAMIKYYNAHSDGTLQTTYPIKGYDTKAKADFGFLFRSYPLMWPQGLVINIITHNFFDDYLAAATAVSQGDTARVLWVLDFAGIYPGILASKRKTYKTGDVDILAQINKDFACVMETEQVEQTLISMTWTMIVECPAGNLIIENFSDAVPEHATEIGTYPGSHTSTTTSTSSVGSF